MVTKTWKIKKFENRKLYDLELSETTSLTAIEELIKNGKFIEVHDHNKQDITNNILADCLANQIKRLNDKNKINRIRKAQLSFLLRELIRENI